MSSHSDDAVKPLHIPTFASDFFATPTRRSFASTIGRRVYCANSSDPLDIRAIAATFAIPKDRSVRVGMKDLVAMCRTRKNLTAPYRYFDLQTNPFLREAGLAWLSDTTAAPCLDAFYDAIHPVVPNSDLHTIVYAIYRNGCVLLVHASFDSDPSEIARTQDRPESAAAIAALLVPASNTRHGRWHIAKRAMTAMAELASVWACFHDLPTPVATRDHLMDPKRLH